MATLNMRFTLSIPPDIAKRTEVLKKDVFYNKPYSEMYRQLIELGIQKLDERILEENDRKAT